MTSRTGFRALLTAGLLALLAGCHVSLTPPPLALPDASLVSAANLATCPTSAGPSIKGGLPELTLHCLGDGPAVHLAGLRGPAIINTWYSNCQPCQEEAPILAQFAARAGSKVLMLGVDNESDPDKGLEFVRDHNLHFAMLTDQHSDFQGKIGVRGYPTTYFLDAAGTLVGPAQIGQFTSLAQMESVVRARLGVTVS